MATLQQFKQLSKYKTVSVPGFPELGEVLLRSVTASELVEILKDDKSTIEQGLWAIFFAVLNDDKTQLFSLIDEVKALPWEAYSFLSKQVLILSGMEDKKKDAANDLEKKVQ